MCYKHNYRCGISVQPVQNSNPTSSNSPQIFLFDYVIYIKIIILELGELKWSPHQPCTNNSVNINSVKLNIMHITPATLINTINITQLPQPHGITTEYTQDATQILHNIHTTSSPGSLISSYLGTNFNKLVQ